MEVKSFSVGDLGTNCYVVYDKDEALIIDMAYGNEVGDILNFLAEKGLKVKAVLLTHGHFDNVGGVAIIKKSFDCPIYINRRDADMARHADRNKYGCIALACPITEEFEEDCDLYISDFEVKVLTTPGHTLGSVCYFIENAMFSGDTLFARSIGRTDLDGSNATLMAQSLKRIVAIESDYTVYPGHMEQTTLAEEKKYNYFLCR